MYTPAPISPSAGACSYTATSMPCATSALAANSPPMPPPTMTTLSRDCMIVSDCLARRRRLLGDAGDGGVGIKLLQPRIDLAREHADAVDGVVMFEEAGLAHDQQVAVAA